MFELIYWLPDQDKICGAPKHYWTEDREEFIRALQFVKDNGYEIEFATDL